MGACAGKPVIEATHAVEEKQKPVEDVPVVPVATPAKEPVAETVRPATPPRIPTPPSGYQVPPILLKRACSICGVDFTFGGFTASPTSIAGIPCDSGCVACSACVAKLAAQKASSCPCCKSKISFSLKPAVSAVADAEKAINAPIDNLKSALMAFRSSGVGANKVSLSSLREDCSLASIRLADAQSSLATTGEAAKTVESRAQEIVKKVETMDMSAALRASYDCFGITEDMTLSKEAVLGLIGPGGVFSSEPWATHLLDTLRNRLAETVLAGDDEVTIMEVSSDDADDIRFCMLLPSVMALSSVAAISSTTAGDMTHALSMLPVSSLKVCNLQGKNIKPILTGHSGLLAAAGESAPLCPLL